MAGRRRGLSPEERELWSRVARSATPMHSDARKIQGKISETGRDGGLPLRAPEPPKMPLSRFRIGQNTGQQTADHSYAPSPAERLAASPVRMDHKTHRRMSQGKLRPEARLDLHGMTLAAAHPELIRFVLSCHGRGYRLVLVITGKGRGDHGPLPTRPGALRHQVPHWLHAAPLASVVQQVTPAHYRHGGEGAYYVYLRK